MQWVAWWILLFFSSTWTLGIYNYIKSGRGITYAAINVATSWWVMLAWSYYYAEHFNKLHLFWLAPLSIVVSMFITTSVALRTVGKPRGNLPPGILLTVGIVLGTLWLLTDIS